MKIEPGILARSLQRAPVVGVALALSACSAGGSSSPLYQPRLATGGGSSGTSAFFTIQIPRASTASSASRRRPQYVSLSTQSIAIATNGQTPVVANLTATSPGCVAATATTPLTCTVTQPATIGADTFALTLYDGLGGAGNVLSTATINHTINSGHANTISVTLNGVVSSLQISLGPSPPIGAPATIAVSVSALDADGNIIISPGNYVNASGTALPITLSDSDKSKVTQLHNTKLSSASSPASTLSYTGAALPSGATITASATGVTPVGALFLPHAPNASKIYVSNAGNGFGTGTVTTYNADGSASAPTIGGLNQNYGVAAAEATGNVYVISRCNSQYACGFGIGTVTTYDPNGNPIAPTIAGLNVPYAVAADAAGKIYVSTQCGPQSCGYGTGTVTTYNADGSASSPTITGLTDPFGVAVGAAGKIYVANACGPPSCAIDSGTVTSYDANGNASSPTITGLNQPSSVAVDATGKIYVASICGPSGCGRGDGIVTTYNADGTASTPTITGLTFPYGVAVDAAGKIYVASNCGQPCLNYTGSVTTYNADGSASTPTITGLPEPLGIAVH